MNEKPGRSYTWICLPLLAGTVPLLHISASFGNLGAFALGIIRSFWGIFYLVLLFTLGQLWVKKWGGFLAIALLGAIVWLFGGETSPPGLFVQLFTSSPVFGFTTVMVYASQALRSAGTGIFLSGLAVVTLLWPAYRQMVKINRSVQEANLAHQLLGTTVARNMMQTKGVASLRTAAAWLLWMLATLTLPIALWIALRRLSASAGPIPLELLRLPDLAAPHWRPVWRLNYFLIPLVYWLANLALSRLNGKYRLSGMVYQNPLLLLTGALLLGLFVPNGVILYLLGQSIGQCLALPLALAGQRGQGLEFRPGPRRWEPEIAARPHLQEPVRPVERPRVEEASPAYRWPEAEGSKPDPHAGSTLKERPAKPTAELIGEPLYSYPCDLRDLAVLGEQDFVVLDVNGCLQRWQNGQSFSLGRAAANDPHGLAALPEEQIALIAGRGELAILSLKERRLHQERCVRTGQPIHCYAFNPFGTIMAYTGPDQGPISGVFLAAGREQALAETPFQPSALAFSADNRYLAAANQAAQIQVLDMASRQWKLTIEPPWYVKANGGGISALSAGVAGGWVAAYDNRDLILWNEQGEVVERRRTQSSIALLAVDRGSGLVATAGKRGRVQVFSSQLEETIIAGQAHQKGSVQLAFTEGGWTLISASRDGQLRAIYLQRN